MERNEIQKLIESLESLKRVTQKAADLFEEEPEKVNQAWWIFDENER